MSTRSYIAMRTPEGYYKGVYCHWDGYLDHNGKILQEHYSDPVTLSKLINLGDISSLNVNVGRMHDFNKRSKTGTTFYMRDRGETGCEPRVSDKLEELMQDALDRGCEFFYLWTKELSEPYTSKYGNWRYVERKAQWFGWSDGSPFSEMKFLKTGETVSELLKKVVTGTAID